MPEIDFLKLCSFLKEKKRKQKYFDRSKITRTDKNQYFLSLSAIYLIRELFKALHCQQGRPAVKQGASGCRGEGESGCEVRVCCQQRPK